MSENHRGDGWWMANDGNLYPPDPHPSVMSNSEGSGTSQKFQAGRDGGAVGPQFPDLFQAAVQGNHLADNVSVKYDGDDQRNVPVTVSAGASSFGTASPRAAAEAPSGEPVGEYTGATAAKRRWRRH